MKETVFSLIRQRGIARGFIVQSTAGHDQMKPYLVLRTEGCFAYLADGELRRLEKPKKKRIRHVKPLGMLKDPGALDAVESLGDSGQKNSALRRLLSEFFDHDQLKEET